jgi:methionyl aminopeptidase
MIILKSAAEIEKMRDASQIVAEVLDEVGKLIEPGITTDELDKFSENLIVKRGGKPAFKGYMGYPKTLCTSVNESVVHEIPGPRVLNEGDIVGVDCGVNLKGYFGDSARTFAVGKVSDEVKELLEVTKKSLYKGIEQLKEGNRLHDISAAVQKVVESAGLTVVKQFVGHGIGTKMHEPPSVPNYGTPQTGPLLEKGVVLALEPMVNMGGEEVEILDDGWTAVTKDRKFSAHFEHTVALTDKGYSILSERI